MKGPFALRPASVVFVILLAAFNPNSLRAHGDVDGQVAALDARIQTDPRNPVLYLQRGELQRHLQHWDLAEKDLRTAERLDDRLAAVHLARALLMLESGRPDQALPSVDRFLIVEPRRADAHETRGRILARLGQNTESEAALSKAIELLAMPTPDIYLTRNEVIVAQGPASYGRAVAGLDDGISRIGSVVTLELAAIELERRMAKWDAALRRIDTMMQLSTRREPWFVRRAEILGQAGRHADAQRAYAQALDAINALPERNRATAATLQLETQIRKNLQSHSESHQETPEHVEHR
jgi:tetratricopeptide (TPR) repeat protein